MTGAACTGTAFTVSPVDGTNGIIPAGTTYSWSAPVVTGGMTGGAAGSGSNITGTLINVTTAVQTATYTVTPVSSASCSGSSFTVTVTIAPVTAGGTIASVNSCGSSSGNLLLTGNVGNVIQWESSINGTTWTVISNTTTSQPYTATSQTTYYRALVQSGLCSSAYSTTATVAIMNYWTGATSTDWNTASNWSGNAVPTTSCPDVYIQSETFEPIVGNAVPAITNLHILTGANVTINNTGTLTLGGTISEVNPNTIIARYGTLNLNGGGVQTIPANTFQNDDLNNLIISNTNASGVTLLGNLNIYESLTYSSSGTNLNTGGFLTLKSTQTETAWVGDMTGHTINGDVTVERYIATGTASPDHPKSWQLLAVPTFGTQTINGAWQEGATASNVSTLGAPYSAGNLNPGYGTMITSSSAGIAQGFDATTSPVTGPSSIKTYVAGGAGSYAGPANTTGTTIYNKKGYFLFVRGDRSVYSAFTPATETVLRTKGTLFTPANLPPVTTVNIADTFETVGNPYASAIDMRNIGTSGDVTKIFSVWDPRLGSQDGYGEFQNLVQIGSDYFASPGGTATYPGFPTPSNYIQSGQAFFVQTRSGGTSGTVTFSEAAKAGGTSNVLFTTPNPVAQTVSLLNTSLYQVNTNGNTTIVDGALALFSDSYSNAIDAMDARKLTNSAENLAIKTAGALLAVTSRHTITAQDTIFFNLTGTSTRAYRFHFDAENLDPSVQGYLVDNYTHSRTPLNMTGTTDADFTIANVTGSNAANRFMIVFEPVKALPVTFTSIKAWRQDKDIDIQWRVDNEVNIKQYEVEKSTDGSNFTSMAQQQPTANNGGSAVYVSADANPVTGFNYYRVRSTDINGKISYTNVVKVLVGTLKQDITIYPNPITDGMIHLQFTNMPEGKYKIRLLNKLGQVILQKQITRANGNGTELIKWDYNLAHGMYQLEVTRPDESAKDINVLY